MTATAHRPPVDAPTIGTAPVPSRRRLRMRLAVGIAATVLIVSSVVAIGAAVLATLQDSDAGQPQVGVAQVDGEVVIIVTEGTSMLVAARTAALRSSLIALALSVIPSLAVGWWVAGRMLGAVDAALTDVEEAARDRDRRLQEVVHELRTPLAVMGTNLELAGSASDVDSESSGFIRAALRALDRMDRTVDDLDGHGGLTVHVADREPVDLGSVAGDVAGEFVGPARSRGVHVAIRGEDEVSASTAEAAPLRTVLGNLMANAVRLAPSGSTITVDWGTEHRWAWVGISDEGPGIAGRDHARMFERGWRGAHERHRDTGAGLGLTIARQLAEAQGGHITVDSGEGTGSTLAVWLPTTPDSDTTDVVLPDGIHPVTTPWRHDRVPA